MRGARGKLAQRQACGHGARLCFNLYALRGWNGLSVTSSQHKVQRVTVYAFLLAENPERWALRTRGDVPAASAADFIRAEPGEDRGNERSREVGSLRGTACLPPCF